jgi:hypothetical protein
VKKALIVKKDITFATSNFLNIIYSLTKHYKKMKKLSLLALLLLPALLFTNCKSDDDKLEGSYVGTINVGGVDAENTTVELKKDGSNYKIKLVDFTFGTLPLGTIEINNVKSFTVLGITTLSREGDADVTVSVGGNPIPVKAELTVGTITGKTLALALSIKEIPAIGTLSVVFSGTKK